MVERIAEAIPPNLQEIHMTMSGLTDAAAISLRGDQYQAYTIVTQNIQASRHQGRNFFFITGP